MTVEDCKILARHSEADVALLYRLWVEEARPAEEIADRFGVTMSTVSKWAKRYGFPKRFSTATPWKEPAKNPLPQKPRENPEDDAPTPEDDAASMNSLALSPSVEAIAKTIRQRHYEARRRETLEQSQIKAAGWRRGAHLPVWVRR